MSKMELQKDDIIKFHYSPSTLVSTIDIEVIYDTHQDNWIINNSIFTNPIRNDHDNKIEICRNSINILLNEFWENSEQIEEKVFKSDECYSTYNITRHLDELVAFYKDNPDEIEKKDLDIRIKCYTDKYQINKETLIYYNDLAYYLEQSGNYEEAVYLLEQIIAQFPDRVVAYINLGDAYWGIGNYKKAKEVYKIYVEQMKANNKENKIPKRVFKRLSSP